MRVVYRGRELEEEGVRLATPEWLPGLVEEEEENFLDTGVGNKEALITFSTVLEEV